MQEKYNNSIREYTHLGRQKLRRATEGLGAVAPSHAFLAQPEVRDLHVALRVQEKVVQLQVPVHDVVLVQVLQGKQGKL